MTAVASRPGWAADTLRALAMALLVMVVASFIWHQPIAPLAMGLVLLLAAAAVAWQAQLIWLIVPPALALLDLTPWTGRLFIDEFDALLAVVIGVAWLRTRSAAGPVDAALRWALLAVLASLLLSSAQSLIPWPAVDANAFVSLTSPFNALRIVRGAVWGLLLWQLARRQRAAGHDVIGCLGDGMVLGLLGTVIAILWERVSFTDWLDVSASYRVAGPFAVMNVGGAYVECFLIVTIPFLLARLWTLRAWWHRLAGASLLIGATYSVMVTFSRAGYAALAFGLTLSLGLAWRQRAAQRQARLANILLVLALVSAVTVPFLLGPFAQSRLARIDKDLITREQHWRHVLSMIDHDLPSMVLGMGIGRYPALDLLHSPPTLRSASYRLIDGDGPRYLRLGAGKALYIEQMVTVQPGTPYRLQVRSRSAAPEARLRINLCEKWLVSSAACVSATVSPSTTVGTWTDQSVALESESLGASVPGRPVLLSFHISGDWPIDLASIQLSDPRGHALLKNSQFNQGLDHWYFSSDDHLAWHTKSLPLALLFDQGLLGLASMSGLLWLALARAGRSAWLGSGQAVPWLLALAGFTVVGLVDTLLDAPRFLMLWMLLCCCTADLGLIRPASRAS